MNTNIKCPIKYAAMPYENFLKEEEVFKFKLIGYVPAKCFVLSENKHYDLDGNISHSSDVVFTWEFNQFDQYGKQVILDQMPKPGKNGSKWSNLSNVEKTFDSYEECLLHVNELNKNLVQKENLKFAEEKGALLRQKQNDLLFIADTIEQGQISDKTATRDNATKTNGSAAKTIIDKIASSKNDGRDQ